MQQTHGHLQILLHKPAVVQASVNLTRQLVQLCEGTEATTQWWHRMHPPPSEVGGRGVLNLLHSVGEGSSHCCVVLGYITEVAKDDKHLMAVPQHMNYCSCRKKHTILDDYRMISMKYEVRHWAIGTHTMFKAVQHHWLSRSTGCTGDKLSGQNDTPPVADPEVGKAGPGPTKTDQTKV